MNQYLFIPTYQDDFKNSVIVTAKSKKEALKIFSNKNKISHSFIEDIHEKSVNMCFAEKFWITNEDQADKFCETGKVLITEDEFKQNVKSYFFDKPKYYELFIRHYFTTFKEAKDYKFPEEMIRYIYLKEFDELDWKILDMDSILILKEESSHGSEIPGDNIGGNGLRKA